MYDLNIGNGQFIINIPDDTPEAVVKEMGLSLRSSSGSGEYNFQQAAQAQAQPTDSASSLSGDPMARWGERQGYIPTAEETAKLKGNPDTTVKGVIDSFAREVGPPAIAAAIGLPLAAAERLSYYLSKPISKLLNKTFDLTGTKWEQYDTQNMYDYLNDAMGLERPDTPTERVAGAIGQGTGEGLATLGAAQTLNLINKGMTTGTAVLDPLKTKVAGAVEQTSNVIADLPAKEMLGNMGAAGGAQAVTEAVEDTDLPEIVKTLSVLGGALFTGVTATKLDDAARAVQKVMRASGSTLPEAAAEVIDLADTYGIDVLTSDFTPNTRAGKDRLIAREMSSGGTRDLRGGTRNIVGQDAQRITAVDNLKTRYGVPEGVDLDGQLDNISKDFWAKRDAEFNKAITARDEVIDSLSTSDIPVDTSATRALLSQAGADLGSGGDQNMQGFINNLNNWREMIDNKNLKQIEEHRDTIGRLFSDQAQEGFKTKKNQEIVDSVYRSLRDDMSKHIESVGSPEELEQFEGAMSELSRLSKDFDTKVGIPAIMSSREAPIKAMSNALFNNSPDEVRKIYQKLSPVGQQNARAALITKMLDESTTYSTMSPNQFTKALKKYGGSRGILFGNEDVDYLGGLKKVLDQTTGAEADQLAMNLLPLDGTPGVSRGIAGFILKHPVTGISTLLGAKAFKGHIIKYIESPKMRDLLLKYDALPIAQRSSTGGQEILKRMGDAMRGYLIAEENSTAGNKQDGSNYQGEQ